MYWAGFASGPSLTLTFGQRETLRRVIYSSSFGVSLAGRHNVAIRQVDGLIIEATGDDHLVYNDNDNSAHALNPMAYRVFVACDGAEGAEQIAEQLTSEGPDRVTLDVVWLALEELSEAGLIVVENTEPRTVNRRDLILKIGVGAAAAAMLPVVEMIVAGQPDSTAAAAPGVGAASQPTKRPTGKPTRRPTRKPTERPTGRPTGRPTERPSPRPTERPTEAPTPAPTPAPTSSTTTSTTTPSPTPAPTPAPSVGGATQSPKFTG
jgi:hypothetical protein